MPNGAQVHLWLNHIPVLGTLFGLLLLIAALTARQAVLKTTALCVLVLTALAALPVYFTGEPAEGVVEHLPGVTQARIDEHEESAEWALAAVETLGVLCLLTLILFRKRPDGPSAALLLSLLIVALLTAAIMARTAHLGGEIRHQEIRSGFLAPPGAAEE
jgi:uncharacterized membrane protein